MQNLIDAVRDLMRVLDKEEHPALSYKPGSPETRIRDALHHLDELPTYEELADALGTLSPYAEARADDLSDIAKDCDGTASEAEAAEKAWSAVNHVSALLGRFPDEEWIWTMSLNKCAKNAPFHESDIVTVFNGTFSGKPIIEGRAAIEGAGQDDDQYRVRFRSTASGEPIHDGQTYLRIVFPGECQDDPAGYLAKAVAEYEAHQKT